MSITNNQIITNAFYFVSYSVTKQNELVIHFTNKGKKTCEKIKCIKTSILSDQSLR